MAAATQPQVSILTPSSSQGRSLADNLRSVAAQTHPAIEHVVIDGGSTDGSVEHNSGNRRHHLQRKSLTRLDLAAQDRVLLERTYRMSALAANPLLCKTLKIGARVAGLPRVREASNGSDVLTLDATSARAIAVRQIAQLRRWMPSGDR